MLPKPDKSKKKFPSDGGEPIETKEEKLAKELKRLQKKRRLVAISIVLTVGLSLSFWTYRNIKKMLTQPRQPKINLSFDFLKNKTDSPTSSGFENQINKIVSSKYSDLSIYVFDNLSPEFNWSKNDSLFNKESIDEIKSRLSNIKPTDKSSLNINLPQGLSFQEIVSQKSGFDYFNQINLPDRKLFILIHSSQSIDISELVESIYWSYIQNFN